MAGEWQPDSLENLIEVKHGFAFAGEEIHEEPQGDVLLTPGNFAIGGGFKADKFKYYDGPVPDEFVLGERDLLVTMTDLSKQADTLGFPAFVPTRTDGRRYLHNQRLGKVVLKDREALDIRYLHYLFPDCLEDSQLGAIPASWHVRRWGELATLEYGKGLSGYNGETGAYPVYGTNGRIGCHSESLCKHPGIVIGRKGAYRGVHF